MAKSHLPRHISDKPDSQGLCFVEPSSGRHFSTFLQDYLPSEEPAAVKLEDGRVVGQHSAIWHVTIGQRSRLNFRESQRLNPGGQWYVASKSSSPPSYVIVPGRDHPKLFSKGMIARDWRWIDEDEDCHVEGLVAQIRHRERPIACQIERVGDTKIRVRFNGVNGAYGVTPGQAVAVWLGDRCLGGGVIEKAE
jgi:tRNA-uridine 2-sulfurtransferase